MWTITFIKDNDFHTFVCQNKDVYDKELRNLQSVGLKIINHGSSMYVRQDDGSPVWSDVSSRFSVKLSPVMLPNGTWTWCNVS